ncbi:hypothetical protein CHUAL_002325 [Chamberlinius hualienensis]
MSQKSDENMFKITNIQDQRLKRLYEQAHKRNDVRLNDVDGNDREESTANEASSSRNASTNYSRETDLTSLHDLLLSNELNQRSAAAAASNSSAIAIFAQQRLHHHQTTPTIN